MDDKADFYSLSCKYAKGKINNLIRVAIGQISCVKGVKKKAKN